MIRFQRIFAQTTLLVLQFCKRKQFTFLQTIHTIIKQAHTEKKNSHYFDRSCLAQMNFTFFMFVLVLMCVHIRYREYCYVVRTHMHAWPYIAYMVRAFHVRN